VLILKLLISLFHNKNPFGILFYFIFFNYVVDFEERRYFT
jgi:hypothetical protein